MVPQSGSTSALGHTYGVDEDVLLPVPAGSGCIRFSLESRQHGGVVTVVVENSDRASPKPCARYEEERQGFRGRVWAPALGALGGAAKLRWPAPSPLLLYI
jgi:hypothetical protein